AAAEAGEPGVAVVVGGAGLAADVLALEHPGRGAGAAAHDVAHHRHHLVGDALVDRARREHGVLGKRLGLTFFRLPAVPGVGGFGRDRPGRGRRAEVEAVDHVRVARLHARAGTAAAAT